MELTYIPGGRLAAVSGNTAVVTDEGVSASVLGELWQSLSAGADLGTLIGMLAGSVGGALLDLPAFAVVVLDPAGARAVVRGELTVRVATPDGEVEVTAAGVTTWTERWFPGADWAEIGENAHAEGWLPLLGGIVRASVVRVGAAPSSSPPATVASAAAMGPVTAPAPVTEALPVQPAPVRSEPEPPEQAQPAPVQPQSETPEPVEPVSQEPEPERAEAERAEPVDAGNATGEETLAGGVEEYDHLWGATVARQIEDAAVRADEDDEDDEPLPPTPPSPAPPAQEEARAPARRAIPPQPAGGLISSVPGFRDGVGDDDHTVSRPDLAALRDTGGGLTHRLPSATGRSGVHVLARPCPAGHANPPQRGHCWVCGTALSGDPVRLPRPALGRLRLSTGAVAELDQGVIIGRRPEVKRVTGAELPHLVTVPDTSELISRNHLEVRLEDWHVLAVDPGSTNGTMLHRAGEESHQLPKYEPMLLRAGDILDLGGGVEVHVEGLP